MSININSKTRLLGLLGNPSRHSFSPLIQNHFLSYYKINCVYLTFEPDVDSLKTAFESAKNLNFIGLNITMPFKEEVFKLVDKTFGAASAIKAINTIKFLKKDRMALGFSTDGDGVIKSFNDKRINLDGKRCLILGAGGVAKSAVFSILQKKIKRIFLYDIVKEKALHLIEDLKSNLYSSTGFNEKKELIKIKFNYSEIEEMKEEKIKIKDVDKKIKILADLKDIEGRLDSVDIIMNCTPAGMDVDNYNDMIPVPQHWNLKNKIIFEMVYKPVRTQFLKKAYTEGAAAIINGIDMLINQAVFSFNIWFGIMPEEKVISKVKEKKLKVI